MTDWKTLDTEKVIKKRQEQTTSAGVGGFAVPLGAEPLRPAYPEPAKKKQRKKKE